MKKFLNASFEQVEPAISESFIRNSLDTARTFKGVKFISFFLLFVVFGSYCLYGASIYIANHIDEAVGGLDVNNEFIHLFSGWWYINIQVFIMLIAIITLRFYRNKNRMKGIFIHHLFVGIYMLFAMTFMFKTFQLFVNPFPLRMLYTGLYIFTFIYSFRIGYYNTKRLVFGEADKRPFLVEWVSRHSKSILYILAIIGGLYFTLKSLSPNVGNMEQRIIGSLADFLPLGAVLANFAIIYYISTAIRAYYAHKHSEAFRKKFGYDQSEWYGPKYKM